MSSNISIKTWWLLKKIKGKLNVYLEAVVDLIYVILLKKR